MILYAPDLQLGHLYQYHGNKHTSVHNRPYELAMYDHINENVLRPIDTLFLDTFVLLEKEERGFPYHGLYWCKVLTTTGIIGWIISNLDYEFTELKDVCVGT